MAVFLSKIKDFVQGFPPAHIEKAFNALEESKKSMLLGILDEMMANATGKRKADGGGFLDSLGASGGDSSSKKSRNTLEKKKYSALSYTRQRDDKYTVYQRVLTGIRTSNLTLRHFLTTTARAGEMSAPKLVDVQNLSFNKIQDMSEEQLLEMDKQNEITNLYLEYASLITARNRGENRHAFSFFSVSADQS